MLLYHGSNVEINEIDLKKCRPYKDFGKGFYTTAVEKQAVIMAKRISRIYGKPPCVTSFEFDELNLADNGIKIRIFDGPSVEWAMFVLNNRNKYLADSVVNSNHDNKYGIVIGPVADDDIALLLRTYVHGLANLEFISKELKYKDINNQYSFHNAETILLLKKIGVMFCE